VRVVAGQLGGRRLISPPGEEVRPTSDRVREALFSILGDLSGLTVLDLFAGTGALGIEAISRGASSATLVDTDIRPAEANVVALSVGDRCDVVRSDAIGFLRRERRQFDLVLCDPPYRLARRLASDLDSLLPDRLAPGARLVFESARSEPVDLGLPLRDERVYGSVMIRIYATDGAD
jgi:16S rRNA (guanine966-N2)-methyltransferase